MRKLPSLVRNLAAAAAVSLVLSACVVAPVGGYDGYYGGTVGYAPPVAQVETVGVAPYPGYVWLGGYWGWSGGRYSWVPGRWSAPRRGYHWVSPGWHRAGNGWRQTRGGWRR